MLFTCACTQHCCRTTRLQGMTSLSQRSSTRPFVCTALVLAAAHVEAHVEVEECHAGESPLLPCSAACEQEFVHGCFVVHRQNYALCRQEVAWFQTPDSLTGHAWVGWRSLALFCLFALLCLLGGAHSQSRSPKCSLISRPSRAQVDDGVGPLINDAECRPGCQDTPAMASLAVKGVLRSGGECMRRVGLADGEGDDPECSTACERAFIHGCYRPRHSYDECRRELDMGSLTDRCAPCCADTLRMQSLKKGRRSGSRGARAHKVKAPGSPGDGTPSEDDGLPRSHAPSDGGENEPWARSKSRRLTCDLERIDALKITGNPNQGVPVCMHLHLFPPCEHRS